MSAEDPMAHAADMVQIRLTVTVPGSLTEDGEPRSVGYIQYVSADQVTLRDMKSNLPPALRTAVDAFAAYLSERR